MAEETPRHGHADILGVNCTWGPHLTEIPATPLSLG